MWNKGSEYIDINKLSHGLGDAIIVSVTLWMGCTHTPDVIQWVTSQVVGSSETWSSWHHSIVRQCFTSWGKSWESSADLFKKLHASTCKLYSQQQWILTQPASTFSRHGVGSSSLASFHHAWRTTSSCMPWALTTRLASGHAVSNNIRKSHAQSSVAGSEMTMTSSAWNGCGDLRLPRQCYRCCRASAAVYASSRNVSAWATAWNVHTCKCKLQTHMWQSTLRGAPWHDDHGYRPEWLWNRRLNGEIVLRNDP